MPDYRQGNWKGAGNRDETRFESILKHFVPSVAYERKRACIRE